jgi:hypothetical protein
MLVGALRAELPGFRVPSPAGGWFVWLTLPDGMTAGALLHAAEQRGVSFVEGTQFFPDGRDHDEHIRLCFSFLAPQELAAAARRLASAVTALGGSRSRPLPRPSVTRSRTWLAGPSCTFRLPVKLSAPEPLRDATRL